MHDLVLVLLGIDDPRDGVDARQKGIDALAVLGRDGVKVREVEDRERAEVGGPVLAYLRHAEPGQETGEIVPPVRGYPRDRLGGGRTFRARRADLLARDRVEEGGLADTGPAGEREHVGVARESKAGPSRLPNARRRSRVKAERGGGRYRFVQVR